MQHPSQKTINTMGHRLYSEAKEKSVAIDIKRYVLSTGKNPPPSPKPAHLCGKPHHHHQEPKSKVSHNLTIIFKYTDSKFSRLLGIAGQNVPVHTERCLAISV